MESLYTVLNIYLVTQIIVSFGIVISTIEDLKNYSIFNDNSLLSWKISSLSSKWTTKGLLANLVNFFLKESHFKKSLYFRLINSFLIFALSFFKIVSPILLFFEIILILLPSLRHLYGLDGSYQVNMLVIFSLFIGALFGMNAKIATYSLWFICAQLLLSYFIAGFRKWQSPIWRNGDAIRLIFATQAYGNQYIHQLIEKRPYLANLACGFTIVLETFFFMIIFINPEWVPYCLALSFLFHLGNAVFMGLNTFLFSFLSTYPSVLFSLSTPDFRIQTIFLTLYIFIPVFLCLHLAIKQSTTWISWISKLFITTSYCFYIYLFGFWPWTSVGFFGRYFVVLLYFICVAYSFINLKIELSPNKTSFLKKVVNLCLLLGVLGLSSSFIFEILQVFEKPKKDNGFVDLDFPLKEGLFYIIQGGSSENINHHYNVNAQKYALDIVRINSKGFRATQFDPHSLEDYYSYKTNIYSPCDGTIIEIVQNLEESDTTTLEGNFVLIQIKDSEDAILLAHLLKDSVPFKKNDVIKKGALIGKIGMTGNTSEPHLHIHCFKLRSSSDYIMNAQGVPMRYNRKHLKRNDLIVN